MKTDVLYYGDNLGILRKYIPDESVDLVYLDPPFNSNRAYSLIFKDESGRDFDAQQVAFDDTWHWGPAAEGHYAYLTNTSKHEGRVPSQVSALMSALHAGIRPSPMLAYLVEMTVRLVELHRVLKPTGSLYLHCDPTASHYLKLVLDGIFGPECFANEVIWKRTATKGDARRKYGSVHDVLLFYGRGPKLKFLAQDVPHGIEYTSRFQLDDGDGRGPYEGEPLDSPNPRPTVAPHVDPIDIIERVLVQDRSAPGGRCATCGNLPEGMTPTHHRAIAVYNRLEQAGLLRQGTS